MPLHGWMEAMAWRLRAYGSLSPRVLSVEIKSTSLPGDRVSATRAALAMSWGVSTRNSLVGVGGRAVELRERSSELGQRLSPLLLLD